MGLKNLEIVRGSFRDIHDLRAFVKHREQEESPLISYTIEILPDFASSDVLELGWDTLKKVVSGWESFNKAIYGWDSFNKVVHLVSCTLCIPSEENDLYLLPRDVQVLIMENIHDLTSLCAIASLNYITDLWFCQIDSCKGVRELVTTSSSSFALQSLQTLKLFDLENLEALIGRNKAPCNVFPCLQELEILYCPRIKVLFNVGLLSNLRNLEKLKVTSCWKLEEIIGESVDDDKDLNQATTDITLPRLRHLSLFDLPNLKSICSPTRRLICESLKEIYIKDCPELEQCVYAALEDSGEPSPSASPQPIELKLCNNYHCDIRTVEELLEELQKIELMFNCC